MSRAVLQQDGKWYGVIWDGDVVSEDGHTCPASAICVKRHESRNTAQRWVDAHERDFITRYRARCAWQAGIPVPKEEHLMYYRLWNADRAADECGETNPDRVEQVWRECYERGW
jgi:hypothetical protein